MKFMLVTRVNFLDIFRKIILKREIMITVLRWKNVILLFDVS